MGFHNQSSLIKNILVKNIHRRSLVAILLGCIIAFNFLSNVSALPGPTGYMVNDWAYLMTYDEEEDLESLCRWIEDETTVEIYIITTDNLQGEDLNRYSYLIFNEWGIGKSDVNNGLLITVYYWENTTHFSYEFRIEIGRGLESAITDSEAGRIGRDNMTFWFDFEYFYEGLYEGVVELYYKFADDPSVRSENADPVGLAAFQAWGYENPVIAGLIIAVGLIVFFNLFQFSFIRGRTVIIPLIGMGALLLFAWWWDDTLAVIGYSIVFALGGSVVISGGKRVRPGGGRGEGGGFTY
jgi:uncharacterized protein